MAEDQSEKLKKKKNFFLKEQENIWENVTFDAKY